MLKKILSIGLALIIAVVPVAVSAAEPGSISALQVERLEEPVANTIKVKMSEGVTKKFDELKGVAKETHIDFRHKLYESRWDLIGISYYNLYAGDTKSNGYDAKASDISGLTLLKTTGEKLWFSMDGDNGDLAVPEITYSKDKKTMFITLSLVSEQDASGIIIPKQITVNMSSGVQAIFDEECGLGHIGWKHIDFKEKQLAETYYYLGEKVVTYSNIYGLSAEDLKGVTVGATLRDEKMFFSMTGNNGQFAQIKVTYTDDQETMILNLSLVNEEEGNTQTDRVASEIQVNMSDGVRKMFEELKFGKWLHVEFNPVWLMSYYEMDNNGFIVNTHRRTEEDITGVTFGWGLETLGKTHFPKAGNSRFNPIEFTYSKDGKVMYLNLSLVSENSPIDPPVVKTSKVYFDLNGARGTAPAPLEGKVGDVFELPKGEGMLEDGYTFKGWTRTADDGIIISGNYNFNEADMTFYAAWEKSGGEPIDPPVAKTSKVYFDLNGARGTAPAPLEGKAGDVFELPKGEGMLEDGYIFKGWTRTADDGIIISGNYNFNEADMTFYAAWEKSGGEPIDPPVAKTSKVYFDLNGARGTAPAPLKGKVGDVFELPKGEGMLEDGYIFKGWSEAADSGVIISTSASFGESDTTYYAVWEAAVRPPSGGGSGSRGNRGQQDIVDEDVPLGEIPEEEVPVIIPEEEVPLAEEPAQEEELMNIEEEDVPLAQLPKTGGVAASLFFGLGGLLTAAGALKRKNEK